MSSDLQRVIRFQTSDKKLWEFEEEAIAHEEILATEKILRNSYLWEYGTAPSISELAEWLSAHVILTPKAP